MLKGIFIAFFMLLSSFMFGQVKANDSLYSNFNRHNKIDSLFLYQKFKWKGNEFELIGIEKVDPFLFEISSKGGLINITTDFSNEDFIYMGNKEEFVAFKLDTANSVIPTKVNAYLYEDQVKGVESYFYLFPDQKDRIYRLVKTKKREDILLYFISPKD